jgi:prepilin-type processing-associated H-X9-DG protein
MQGNVMPTPQEIAANRIEGLPDKGAQPFGLLMLWSGLALGDIKLESELRAAALFVVGANPDEPALKDLTTELKKASAPHWRISLPAPVPPEATATTATVTPDQKEATVKVWVGTHDHLGMQLWQEEEVPMRREETAVGTVWRIVPYAIDDIARVMSWNSPKLDPLRLLATYIAHPRELLQQVHLNESQMQVKQLALGVMQYSQDWDETYPPNIATFKEKLLPYVRGEALFTAPTDEAGRQSYNFNPALANKKLAALNEVAQTVMIYLGKDKNLDFRFGGKTVVGFADGHVEAVDAERARTLRWNP